MADKSEFPKAAPRFDPYKNYKFRVKWEGRTVAGVSKVSAFKPAAPAARRLPGQSAFEAVTLERGVTHDAEFAQWANQIWDYRQATIEDRPGGGDPLVSLADFRKDVGLEVYDGAGRKVLAYTVFRCWPSEFTALPELDASGNAVAIQSLKLENEGWEREVSVPEPAG